MALLSAVAIAALALLIAAALFLMYEIGRLVGEKTATDKLPEAKKAAIHRSRLVLSGMFAEQLAPYLPTSPSVPPRRNLSAHRSTSWYSKAWTRNTSRKSSLSK
jgi:hypothetical protein